MDDVILRAGTVRWGSAISPHPKHGATTLTTKPGAWPMLEPSYGCHASTNSSVGRLNEHSLIAPAGVTTCTCSPGTMICSPGWYAAAYSHTYSPTLAMLCTPYPIATPSGHTYFFILCFNSLFSAIILFTPSSDCSTLCLHQNRKGKVKHIIQN